LLGTSYSESSPCSDGPGNHLHYLVYLVQQTWADSDGVAAESAADASGAFEGNAGAAAAAEKWWTKLPLV
jgi:hypothetical protein